MSADPAPAAGQARARRGVGNGGRGREGHPALGPRGAAALRGGSGEAADLRRCGGAGAHGAGGPCRPEPRARPRGARGGLVRSRLRREGARRGQDRFRQVLRPVARNAPLHRGPLPGDREPMPQAIEIYRSLFTFFPDNLDYGLHLSRAQARAGKGNDALATIASLRRSSRTTPNGQQLDEELERVSEVEKDQVGRRQAPLLIGGRPFAPTPRDLRPVPSPAGERLVQRPHLAVEKHGLNRILSRRRSRSGARPPKP